MSIPAIDLSPFFRDEGIVLGDVSPPTKDQLEVASKINQACRDHGFVRVENYGMTPELRAKLFQASSELFALEEEHKKSKLRRIEPATNMGYSPYQSESLNPSRPAELKEAFNLRFPPNHQNDFSNCPQGFAEVSNQIQEVLKVAARRYALACALALGLPRDTFVKTLDKMDLCTIRLLHYPPCEFDESCEAIRIGEHTDFGAYTFLLVGDSGADGLQLKSVEGGEVTGTSSAGWLDVEVPPHSTLVNTGALMARWTNDEWNATAHRVIVSSEEMASRDRYSIAFFVDPDHDAIVEVHDNFLANGKEKKYEPTTGAAYLKMKLEAMMKRRNES